MGYLGIIDANLRLAFRQLKDLAVEATHNPTTTDFDFATGEVSSNASTAIVFKLVVVDSQSKSSVTDNQTSSVMFKTTDFPKAKVGDKISFSGSTWIINPELRNTGHIILANVSKEG